MSDEWRISIPNCKLRGTKSQDGVWVSVCCRDLCHASHDIMNNSSPPPPPVSSRPKVCMQLSLSAVTWEDCRRWRDTICPHVDTTLHVSPGHKANVCHVCYVCYVGRLLENVKVQWHYHRMTSRLGGGNLVSDWSVAFLSLSDCDQQDGDIMREIVQLQLGQCGNQVRHWHSHTGTMSSSREWRIGNFPSTFYIFYFEGHTMHDANSKM